MHEVDLKRDVYFFPSLDRSTNSIHFYQRVNWNEKDIFFFINDWFGWVCSGNTELKKSFTIYVVEVFGLYISLTTVPRPLTFINLIGE